MKVGNRFFSESVAQIIFQPCGDVVRLAQGEVRRQANMQVNDGRPTHHAGAQLMRFADAGDGLSHRDDFRAHFRGEALVRQETDLLANNLPSCLLYTSRCV